MSSLGIEFNSSGGGVQGLLSNFLLFWGLSLSNFLYCLELAIELEELALLMLETLVLAGDVTLDLGLPPKLLDTTFSSLFSWLYKLLIMTLFPVSWRSGSSNLGVS
jgi:hypothetical protein